MHKPGTVTRSVTLRRTHVRSLLGAGLVSVALALSACGGSHDAAAGRPSVKELTESLTSGSLAQEMGLDKAGVPTSTMSCVAQKLEASKLSDGALRALLEADKDFNPSDDDQAALTDVASQIPSCATQ